MVRKAIFPAMKLSDHDAIIRVRSPQRRRRFFAGRTRSTTISVRIGSASSSPAATNASSTAIVISLRCGLRKGFSQARLGLATGADSNPAS